MKKYLASFTILSMLLFSHMALAAVVNHDISTGSLIIPAASTDEYVITGSTTSNYVIVEFGWKGTITLKECTFDFYYQSNSPIRITGKNNLSNSDPSRTNVNLILDGDNYIYNDGGDNSCIQVDQGAQINISAIEPCNNSSGTLTALQANNGGGAAIGSRSSSGRNETSSYVTLSNGVEGQTAGGNIVISSGIITARGGHGAGIGGGCFTYYDGMIVIYGGIINSTAIFDAAGIGSGCPVGTGLVKEYAPNSAIVVLPPAVISAKGAGASASGGVGFDLFPELGLAGTKVCVYIGDPDKPKINVKTIDNAPNANIYFDLSRDPDINRVVTATIDPTVLNINSVLLGKTNASGLFTTTGSLTNTTTFFTDATTSTGSPYVPVEKTLPNGGIVELGILETDFNIRQTPSTMLEYGYTNSEAEKSATVVQISYNDNKPMTNVTFDLASGSTTTFSNPIFLASDSSTVIPAPTTLKKGDVFYVIVPIKVEQMPKVHTDVLRILGTWDGSSTGYIRQVITQIVADIRIVDICEGDSYFFNGENLIEPGIYIDTTTVSSACATGMSLNDVVRLVVHKPEITERYDTVCDGKAFVWAGETYTASGDYTKTFANRYGCDSTVTLHLSVSAPYSHEISDTICAGETYSWDGMTYDKTGDYTRKYTSIEGCDSIVTLHLTVGEKYDIVISDTICDGETYIYNGIKHTKIGVYTYEYSSQYGCDSIVTLHLTVGDLYNISIYDTICDGETYTWDGTEYTKSGVYPRMYTSRYGCDSLVTLNLLVADVYDHVWHDTICNSEVFTWNGITYNKSGSYTQFFKSQYGCDSIVTLNLTVAEVYDIHLYDTICDNDVYTWNGITYSKSGSYTQFFKSQYGCDSTVTVHLLVASAVYETIIESICQDQPYYFGNNILFKPGIYVDTAVSMYGCDSITKLYLQVSKPYLIDQYIEVCHNDTFTFRGMVINEPGIYYDSLLTTHGCDSVYRLIYNKTPTYMFESEDSICVGSTYNFRGKNVSKPGIYYDSLATVSGCDSIYKLTLHNFSHSDIYSVRVADVCGDEQTLKLIAHYEGDRPQYYNIIYSAEANNQGFKNVIQVPFTSDTIEAPMPNANPYIRPDYYAITLQFGNYKCPQSVSEHTTDFLIRYPSWIIEQNWQNVVAVLNAQYNGGYHFQNYEWYVNNQPASQNRSYLYLPELRVGDEVELHVMRNGEDHFVPTCPIIIEQQDMYYQENPTPVEPARVSCVERAVTLEALANTVKYYLYDITGKCLLEGLCRQGQVQQFELPNIDGSYFLTMIDEKDNKQTIHLLVD